MRELFFSISCIYTILSILFIISFINCIFLYFLCLHEIFFFGHKLTTIPRQGQVWVKEGLGKGGIRRRLCGSDTCISVSN